MLADLSRWVVLGALIVALAVALNALWPAISGHVAMGLATGILVVVLYWWRASDAE